MKKKTNSLAFCEHCGLPLEIPNYIIKSNFMVPGMTGVNCNNCKREINIPNYIRKIAGDL